MHYMYYYFFKYYNNFYQYLTCGLEKKLGVEIKNSAPAWRNTYRKYQLRLKIFQLSKLFPRRTGKGDKNRRDKKTVIKNVVRYFRIRVHTELPGDAICPPNCVSLRFERERKNHFRETRSNVARARDRARWISAESSPPRRSVCDLRFRLHRKTRCGCIAAVARDLLARGIFEGGHGGV